MQREHHFEARRKWERARRRAFWHRLLINVQGSTDRLVDFNDLAHRLSLKNAVYRGAKVIPLVQIVGSVGRYNDFTGAFLPIHEDMGERWRKVASIQLDPRSEGLPPIEVYKVGDFYFVKDGNHRVSVNRQLGGTDIEAYVWEYTDCIPDVGPNANIDTLLIEAERKDFVEQTCLDTVRPNHNIRLSAPGGYTDLLCRIEHFQSALNQIDNVETPYCDAVEAWYDMIYETSVQMIERDGILELFPDRTAADFFVWVMRHQEQLAERYGHRVPLLKAIHDLRQQPGSFIAAIRHTLRRGVKR
ncbi:MAG TPA: hypothetical protein VKQ72_17895 [Aggregatilineales bacterium]|nr:hypothetical protein [Aggregatilineales bacterium]